MVGWIKIPTTFAKKEDKRVQFSSWTLIPVNNISHIEPYFNDDESADIDDSKLVICLLTGEKLPADISVDELEVLSKIEIVDLVNGMDQDSGRDTEGHIRPI